MQLPLSVALKAPAAIQIFNWMAEYIKTFARNRVAQLLPTWSPHTAPLSRLISALSVAGSRAAQNPEAQAGGPSASEAASATLSSVLSLFSIFLFPAPEFGVSWREADLQQGFAFVQALVDSVKAVFLKESRVSALDQLWRWWINQGILSLQTLVSSKAHQTLFELEGWVDLPWQDASFSIEELSKEVIKVFDTFPSQETQPYVTTCVKILCRIVQSRASSIDELSAEKAQASLLAIYDFLVCVVCAHPWPLGLPIERVIKETINFLPWHKLPPMTLASSVYTSKYILEYFNNQQERSYFDLLPAAALLAPASAPSIAVSTSNVHEKMALRLFTCVRIFRAALCWASLPTETRGQVALLRMDHYALYVDLIMELCPRSFSIPFAVAVVGDIFSSIGKLGSLLFSTFTDGQSPEQQAATEHIMRMVAVRKDFSPSRAKRLTFVVFQRMLSTLNADFNPGMCDVVQRAAMAFVSEFPSLALLVLRATSIAYVRG